MGAAPDLQHSLILSPTTSMGGVDHHHSNATAIHETVINVYSSTAAETSAMPSELDPLLPQTRSAPEISGYGFAEPASNEEQRLGNHEESTSPSSNTHSSLSRIIALFTVVVSLSLFIALVLSGISRSKVENPQRDNATIAARVDKILSQTPLIGQSIASSAHAIESSVD